jgi:hypothetical protein
MLEGLDPSEEAMFHNHRGARLALGLTIPVVGLLGAVGLAAADDRDDPRLRPVVSTVPAAVGSNVDISGPCDEAEHANDPRCAGVVVAATTAPSTTAPSTTGPSTVPSTTVPSTTVPGGVDISGPCDEAEHANDPRCTGGVVAGNGGSGSSDDGSNRGPGSDDHDHDDDDDRSGHGGGDDRDGSGDDHGSGGHGRDD